MMSKSFKHVYDFIFMLECFADLSVLLLINPVTNDWMMSCVLADPKTRKTFVVWREML